MKRSILILTIVITLVTLALPAFAARSVTKSFTVSATIPVMLNSAELERTTAAGQTLFDNKMITLDYVQQAEEMTIVRSMTVL